MAYRFKNIDRNTPMLLPPDLREWVGEDDLVHFIIAAIERLPLSAFAVNHKGCGDEQFPPQMMLALLIYCYANGIFGNRRIDGRLTGMGRCATSARASTIPITTRSARSGGATSRRWPGRLSACSNWRALKLLKLGCVSIDGTHIRASASKDKNVTCGRACQLREQLRLDVGELLARAEAADREDAVPQKLPEEIARREKLLEKMDNACAQLEARAQARADAERAEYERKVAARAAREGSTKGPEPKPPKDTPEPDERINLTDADAQLMRKSKREGYTQSDNAPAVVDTEGSQLILGDRVSNCASDAGELEADLESIPPSLGQPSGALADCGYADKEVIERVGRERPELDLYVGVHREDAHSERRYDFRPPDKIKPPKTITDPVLVAMAGKLKTPEGKATYRRRACTVEPVFGIIKAALGFRQFLLRRLQKVRGEWKLVCLAYNRKRLQTLGKAPAIG